MKKIEGIKLKKLQTMIIFVLVLINGFVFYTLMNKVYLRLDFTDGKKYSISKPTIDLIQKLENKLIINYYYEKRTQGVPGIAQVIQYIDDTLQEYENNSKGMIEYKLNELSFENPNDRQKIDEIEKLGIKTVSLSQNDGAEAKNTLGFSGLVIDYKGKATTMGTLFTDAKFEYDLDIELSQLMGSENNEKIGILVSSNTRTLEKDYRHLYQFVTAEYKDAEIISDAAQIPQDVTTLIIVGGEALTEYQTYKIDQFVMSGGNILAVLNGVVLNFNSQYGGPQAYPSQNPMIRLLADYGITVNADLVGDNLSFNPVAQRGQLFVEKLRYPLWVKIATENLNKESVIVEDFSTINLFWPSSITIADRAKENTKILFTTTKEAWSMKSDYKVDLDSYKYPTQEGKEQFVLGVSYDGAVSSSFADKPVPKNEGDASKETPFISNGKSKIVVIANEDFLSADFVNREDELLLALNAIDWLTKDGSLISIRNKGKFSRPLNKVLNKTMFNAYKNIIIGFTTYGIPVLFIIIGIFVSVIRRKKYKLIENRFSNPEVLEKDGGK
ncbi:MAG: hypothetical protein A2015_04035 [Spirochaetes bacterium GWF1_31_7]|nr:MAG: hypothetical protein A2Y30_14720 [Spirochaetes bacterium GWE1_32_154]OHD48661.1 MAG: hypothetical protein A2015_04035 [Spirochaetes bacterium GWF1_31_7]OHD50208.1 MAG: hypothetical protein A2Y29_12765 [Spirochaetes bacterium GWE2_31_10]HBD94011.1 hypothetical protein [Spirochaetia bacterium]HBI38681.1 hypothetical protein [Spirochaetia bacterium]